MDNARNALRLDPRVYQIATLSALLLYGTAFLHFPVGIMHLAMIVATALLTQALCDRIWRLPAFDPKSPLISSLSLCLLLRVDNPWLAAGAAAIAIGSKFLLRWNGKHVFNPTALGIAVVVALSDRAWVSPAQWGAGTTVAFLVACLGGIVVNRAARSDVAYAFVATFAAILFGRAAWLGQPWTIPVHQLQAGSLVLFTFFMISDPKTTPNARAARFLFGALVAVGAAFVAFVLYKPSGPIWSLVVFSPLVPLLDRVLPGLRYEWTRPTAGVPVKGDSHESLVPGPRALPNRHALGAGRA
jgi:Na+-transporting NADH:ubiquinone oxidoreductase subunit NqrB